MKRFLTLTAFLTITLSVAACGGSEPRQSGQAAPGETQAAPAPESAPPENAPEESPPAEDESAKSEQEENARGDGESAGLSVTTLQGERVSLGGKGDVTALFFMAGW